MRSRIGTAGSPKQFSFLTQLVYKALAIVVFFTCANYQASGETLGSVLAANHIPATQLRGVNLNQLITSFAVSTSGAVFLISYYDSAGAKSLRPVMHVSRFNRKSGEVEHAVLRGKEIHLPGPIIDQLPSFCFGSVLSISEEHGLIVIQTHLSPSASCLFLLNSDLSFKAALAGGLAARFGDLLIVGVNIMHFAPTHPETLSVFDPQRKLLTPIYPARGDAKRREFSKLLETHLPSRAWCRQNNNACDPTKFTTAIYNVTVNVPRHAFSFDATMSPEGLGKQAEAAVAPQKIHYECTLQDGNWALASK